MRDIRIDNEFVALSTWIYKSGVYIITGNKKGGQLELATMLGIFAGDGLFYKKLEEGDDLCHLVYCIEQNQKGVKECVVIDGVSKDIIESASSFLRKLNYLAKKNNVRFFVCCNNRLKNFDGILNSVCGVIEVRGCSFCSTMKLRVWTSVCKQFKLGFQKFYPRYDKNSKAFEEFIRKCYNDNSIMNAFVDICYDDIVWNRDAYNFMLYVNNKKYKQYEIEMEGYLLRLIKNVHELWKVVLEFGNGLDEYIFQLFNNTERTLLLLYDQHDKNKIIAVLGICDGEVKEIIYHHDVTCFELKKCVQEYVGSKEISISEDCHWGVREMLYEKND